MNLILLKFGYPPVIIETSKKEDYLNALQYPDNQDIDKFVEFIAQRLIEALELWLIADKGENITASTDIDKYCKNDGS